MLLKRAKTIELTRFHGFKNVSACIKQDDDDPDSVLHARLINIFSHGNYSFGLSPFAPEAAAIKAGRLMLEEIAACVRRGDSFAFETTLSGLGYLRHIAHWRGLGYRVGLYFLALPNAETAIARVAERVRQGGHDIPEPVIRRRFAAGLRNVDQRYKARVDTWAKYDNAGVSPVLLDWGENA
ncbi:hypothetical protein [Azomonas macrocytogenes]|uniref:Putative ABC-type ATPase n=1 Tax=Azomonas macrocytogenes TaxID=69962 RepID=A0A839T3T2_AZOMA|nr:hypothetical protein [Azomonas macrocytogenes]MBB3103146.1 putative ABC-type ATPase [Azomonas macrocytogenes]